MAKTYADTYLYGKYGYEKNIFEFLMNADQISTVDDSFDDIKYEFKKRQLHSCLLKVLCSNNVFLMKDDNGIGLSRQFKVICSKDPKTKSSDYKIFIDCSGLIYKADNGNYKCRNIDTLISYILNGMVTMIYHKAENSILTASIVEDAMRAFSSLFTHVIDYLFKISTIPSTKLKCQYLACMYFVICILKKDFNDNYKHMSSKIVDISDREQEMIINQCDKDDFINIKTFTSKLSEWLKCPNMKVDNVVEKWIYLYGINTLFGLEYYPALSAMLTDAYVGSYINNQKTIEKVVGNTLVSYSKNVIAKGGDLV